MLGLKISVERYFSRWNNWDFCLFEREPHIFDNISTHRTPRKNKKHGPMKFHYNWW